MGIELGGQTPFEKKPSIDFEELKRKNLEKLHSGDPEKWKENVGRIYKGGLPRETKSQEDTLRIKKIPESFRVGEKGWVDTEKVREKTVQDAIEGKLKRNK